jgi:hypothetical protein
MKMNKTRLLAAAAAVLLSATFAIGLTTTQVWVGSGNVSTGNPMPVTCVTGCSGGGSGGDASAANQVITNSEIGATNESAAATDTSTSGLNGLMKRLNQRLTTLITGPLPVSQNGTWTVQPGNTANTTPWLTADSTDGNTGSAVPAKAGYIGGIGSGSTGGNLTGFAVGDSYKAINVSTATTTLLVTGVASRQVRITALHLIAAGADSVAIIEGTGATCGTGTTGMAGGTTAASGYNLAANGGLAFGSGLGTIMQTLTAGDSVCVVTSAAVQISGGLQYTIY